MDVITILEQIRGLTARIKRAQRKLDTVRSRAMRCTRHYGVSPGSGCRRDLADDVIMIEDARDVLDALVNELTRLRAQIHPVLDRLEGDQVRQAMELYYLRGMSAVQIGVRMTYDERHVRRLLQAGREMCAKGEEK